jgi:hypothetical protein
MPKQKADMIRALRKALRNRGLIPVTVNVKPENRKRLEVFVNEDLGDYCPPKRGSD